MTTSILKVPGANVRNISVCLPKAPLIETPAELPAGTTWLILPGVGNFGSYLAFLEDHGWGELLRHWRDTPAGISVLGICSGFQSMCVSSEEAPGVRGLEVFDAEVTALQPDLDAEPPVKVPHVGRRPVETAGGFDGIDDAYFTHSFGVASTGGPDERQWVQIGGNRYVAGMQKGVFTGLQYHPELSGERGQRFLDWLTQAGESHGALRAARTG